MCSDKFSLKHALLKIIQRSRN